MMSVVEIFDIMVYGLVFEDVFYVWEWLDNYLDLFGLFVNGIWICLSEFRLIEVNNLVMGDCLVSFSVVGKIDVSGVVVVVKEVYWSWVVLDLFERVRYFYVFVR